MVDAVQFQAVQSESVQAQSAGTLRVLSSERVMKTYVLTTNEIRTLSIMNFAVAALFSLGSACLGYWLNTYTNLVLVDKLPPEALILKNMVQPIALVGCIIFYFLGVILWYQRGGYLNTIEKETVSNV